MSLSSPRRRIFSRIWYLIAQATVPLDCHPGAPTLRRRSPLTELASGVGLSRAVTLTANLVSECAGPLGERLVELGAVIDEAGSVVGGVGQRQRGDGWLRGCHRTIVAAHTGTVKSPAVLMAVIAAAAAAGIAISTAQRPPSRAPLPPAAPSAKPTPIPQGPISGAGYTVADDPATGQVVLFGGVDDYDNTWVWTGTRWGLA